VWIGGGTSAGKTSMARELARRYGLTSYHVDQHEHDHARRRDARRHPAMDAWNARTLDETWVDLPVEQLVEATLAYSRERIEFIVEDLRALAAGGEVIAEGFQLTPEVVAPLLESPRQAVWLLPTRELPQRAAAEQIPGVGDTKSDARSDARAGQPHRA
jgi:hypothetical protein